MFSTGQLIFAICFLIIFIGILVVSYRKDRKLSKPHYSGTVKVLIGFILFIGFLFLIKYVLKR